MIGQINIDIYFGTHYDPLNVPYAAHQIAQAATKTLTLTGYYEWQTTWLDTIRVKVNDYQDIVGAQYVRITDTGTQDHGAHWYTVLGYRQITQSTAELGLMYDALLSIGFNHITSISGTKIRWTVDEDTPYLYSKTAEPLAQTADYVYSYYEHAITNKADSGTVIMGVPVDMGTAPEVVEYINQDTSKTNIYYPKLLPAAHPTSFKFTDQPDTQHSDVSTDGLTYYLWDLDTPAKDNYNLAVGLGYDLQTMSYRLPASSLIVYNSEADGRLISVDGRAVTVDTGFSRSLTGYNNAKAGEIGLYYTLTNPLTGDSVTAAASELDDVKLQLFTDTTANGCFMARFASYMHDRSHLTGLVKSCGWQPVTLTSAGGFGAAMSAAQSAMAYDSIITAMTNQQNSNTAQLTVASASNAMQLAGTLAKAGDDFSIYDPSSWLTSGATTAVAAASAAAAEAAAIYQYQVSSDNIRNTARQQQSQLAVTGTLGANVPPLCKYARTQIFTHAAYNFIVRQSSITPHDRKTADEFFTGYGYNVGRMPFNGPSDLRCRQRFTFIQAEGVEIIPALSTRTQDMATRAQIKERFASGLRIWLKDPDYNYSIPNPIRSDINA